MIKRALHKKAQQTYESVYQISLVNSIRHLSRRTHNQLETITIEGHELQLPKMIAADFKNRMTNILLTARLMEREVESKLVPLYDPHDKSIYAYKLAIAVYTEKNFMQPEESEGGTIELHLSHPSKDLLRVYCAKIGRLGKHTNLHDYVCKVEHLEWLEHLQDLLI